MSTYHRWNVCHNNLIVYYIKTKILRYLYMCKIGLNIVGEMYLSQ